MRQYFISSVKFKYILNYLWYALKIEVSISDWNFSFVCCCLCCKLFTFVDFYRTTKLISTKFGTKHSWVKGREGKEFIIKGSFKAVWPMGQRLFMFSRSSNKLYCYTHNFLANQNLPAVFVLKAWIWLWISYKKKLNRVKLKLERKTIFRRTIASNYPCLGFTLHQTGRQQLDYLICLFGMKNVLAHLQRQTN